MNNQSNIEKLISTGKTVFTIDDLAVIWEVSDRRRLVERAKYYVRQGRLKRIHKGVYGYGEYTPLEVAQKLVPLSYVSLYTAAQIHGLTFQYYATTFSVSLKSKRYDIDKYAYEYHRVKESIFYNALGLVRQPGYTMASKERTICDLLYVYPNTAFDNLNGLNISLLHQLASVYENKRLERRIRQFIEALEREG